MDVIEYVQKKVFFLGSKKLVLAAFCFLLSVQLNAQTKNRPIWLSVHVGHQEYRGDLGNEFLNYQFGTDWVLGYQGSMYLNSSMDVGLTLSIGELDIQDGFIQGNPDLSENTFSKTYVNTYLFGRYKFANGTILPDKSFIKPYLNVGIGLTAFGGGDENVKNGITFTIPGTFGIDIPINKTVKLYVQSTYNRTFADGFDGSDRLDGRSHDDYLVYAAGVKVALSASKREPQGGMQEPDYNAPIPPPATEKAKEIETEEPGEAAKPGTNRDGFNGKAEETTEVEEKTWDMEVELEIPDTDGDGFNDDIDSCPSEAGLSELSGCPVKEDRDNDDIIDEEDACPDESGPRRLNGCPPRDSDEDGLNDDRDECPKEAGLAETDGCPEVQEKPETAIDEQKGEPAKAAFKEEQPVEEDSKQELSAALKKKLDVVYNHLQYKPGKAILMDSSKDDLDELAQIMEENPKLQLIIEGYTDNAGKASYNLLLSKDRADAVKQYIRGRGIDEIRLRAEGYGEISPITTNDTEAGRAKNRRVELRLTYHWVL